jgi:hypothetical protein
VSASKLKGGLGAETTDGRGEGASQSRECE